MRLDIAARLSFTLPCAAELIAKLEVARAPGQTIVRERLMANLGVDLLPASEATTGARLRLGRLEGYVDLDYTATVDVEHRLPLHAEVERHAWHELPADVLQYLLGSRYCPADAFMRFAQREFGEVDGGARVLAILDWIHEHVDYVSGISTAETTAADTFVDRAGVCRDFTHLGITLCRAGGIPARAVAAYAWQLNPPDFHAIFEVWLGGGWWIVDATRLAPIEGLARIAHGRDAADIAFLTTDAGVENLMLNIAVNRVDA